MIRGFDPIAGADARVLVLGTAPSVRSLEIGEYYGHPRNAFWPIMLALFGGRPGLDYPSRTELLVRARVAVWDVLHSADRPGSLDASIVAETAVPNDIAGFLTAHPEVARVFFNGTAAQALFKRHVLPALPIGAEIGLLRLPSTSPANAATPFEGKLAAWRAVADAARGRAGGHLRDARFVVAHRGGPLTAAAHRLLADWAAACAEHTLPLFCQTSADARPRDAVDAARAWVRGAITVGEARAAASAAHEAARAAESASASAAARAAGHAAATAHMADHCLQAASYARAAVRSVGGSADAEHAWQDQRLPLEVRALVSSVR